MTRDDIIRMAREAHLVMYDYDHPSLERFAAFVAEHTLANIDPSKFMSYQEGLEAGRLAEREACAEIEKELMLSPAFFATMDEYNAHKDAVLAYRNLILAREQV